METERTHEQNERLKAVQMVSIINDLLGLHNPELILITEQADLGITRREMISTSEDMPGRIDVSVEQLEATRASNIRGTQAQLQATKDKRYLDGWKSMCEELIMPWNAG